MKPVFSSSSIMGFVYLDNEHAGLAATMYIRIRKAPFSNFG
jgi:hypothetical protein